MLFLVNLLLVCFHFTCFLYYSIYCKYPMRFSNYLSASHKLWCNICIIFYRFASIYTALNNTFTSLLSLLSLLEHLTSPTPLRTHWLPPWPGHRHGFGAPPVQSSLVCGAAQCAGTPTHRTYGRLQRETSAGWSVRPRSRTGTGDILWVNEFLSTTDLELFWSFYLSIIAQRMRLLRSCVNM